MNPRSCWVGLAFFMSSALTLRAVNPDLVSAPAPNLSQGAWSELHKKAGLGKIVTLHVRITAQRGFIRNVAVQEIGDWPQTGPEVQSWIQQKWKFNRDFSGTVVQPIVLSVAIPSSSPGPIPAKIGSWGTADRSQFVRADVPPVPFYAANKVADYQDRTREVAGVLLQITARNGVMVDVRVLDQRGPTELSDFTVSWVRKHWQFRSDVNGTFRIPIYYKFNGPSL